MSFSIQSLPSRGDVLVALAVAAGLLGVLDAVGHLGSWTVIPRATKTASEGDGTGETRGPDERETPRSAVAVEGSILSPVRAD